MFGRRLLARRRDGSWELSLGGDERELLADLARQLTELLADDPADEALQRLLPPAYPDDVDLEAEWQVFKVGELRNAHAEHLAVLETTATRTRLSEDEVRSWMQALNSLRLVLGTRLDVSEDDDDFDPADPEAPVRALYEFLGMLLDATVTALSR